MGYVVGYDGVKFPATQASSSDANTLDDYEEGTFTPTLTFGGGSTGLTYGTQVGTYTKIGRKVNFYIRITLTNKGSSTGSAVLNALPFTSANDSSRTPPAVMVASVLTFTGIPYAKVNSNATTIELGTFATTGAITALTETGFANTTSLFISGSYETV